MPENRSRLTGYWYVAIAAGFILLAINHMIAGHGVWPIVVRVIIAGGFAFLAWIDLRNKSGKRP